MAEKRKRGCQERPRRAVGSLAQRVRVLEREVEVLKEAEARRVARRTREANRPSGAPERSPQARSKEVPQDYDPKTVGGVHEY